jgi:hypothetical protein
MHIGSVKLNRSGVKDMAIILAPLALFFVPMAWLTGNHSLCLIKNIFGVECFGCGITRAIVSAVQLHFAEAYHYNKLIVVVFPLLMYIWIKTLYSLVNLFKSTPMKL